MDPFLDGKQCMDEQVRRAIIHVDMDAFYASVEQLDQPELAGKPVVVGGIGGRGVVAAASYEARRFGVHSAMPTAQARRLCPRAVFVAPRMSRYRAVSEHVFSLFHLYTPLVEGLSLDEAFLDVTGSVRLFGSIDRIGAKIRDDILDQTGLVASIGMAHNKFLAKLASDAGKPAGFVSVSPDHVAEFLDPMPVGRLWGIGRKTEPLLKRMGVLTVGQLRSADSSALRSALGQRTGHFLSLARGEDDRPVSPDRRDKSISHEVTFDNDLLDAREMRAELQRQAEAVMQRLRGKGLAARTVQVKIRDHRFHTVTRRRSLRSASNQTDTIYSVASGLLTTWLGEHANTPVRLLGVGVSGLEEGAREVAGLDRAMDGIAERYGKDKITHAQTLARRQRKRRD